MSVIEVARAAYLVPAALRRRTQMFYPEKQSQGHSGAEGRQVTTLSPSPGLPGPQPQALSLDCPLPSLTS